MADTHDEIDKVELYEQFAKVSAQMKNLLVNVEQLQEQMTNILAENARLSLENERLAKLAIREEPEGNELSDPKQNLQKLYAQGFHVCNEYFGKRLEINESCTFCLEAIYNKS